MRVENNLENQLLFSLSAEELEQLIKDKIISFHGLLNREAALRLIAIEKGLLKNSDEATASTTMLINLLSIPKNGRGLSLNVQVLRIWPIAFYKSGAKSRVIEITDGKNNAPLVLWGPDVSIADELLTLDQISITNAYENNDEIHLGHKGIVKIFERATLSKLFSLSSGTRIRCKGIVSKIVGLTSSGFSFFIRDMADLKDEIECILVEGKERSEKIKEGYEVFLDNARLDSNFLSLDLNSRILIRNPQDFLSGVILSCNCEDKFLCLNVSGTSIKLSRDEALSLLKVTVSEDIRLSTLVDLKKEKLLNSQITIKLKRSNEAVK